MRPCLPRVFANARLWTGDRAAPSAQALAVADGKIVAVGSAGALANAFPGSGVEDLAGAWVTPGIHDAHLHLATGALLREQVDLAAASSQEDAAQRIARATERLAPGEWLRAWGWDHTRWPGAAWPTRAALDRVVPDHPVVATRIDGHTAWVNAAALTRLGDPRPEEHAGILVEQGAERAVAAIPAPSAAARRRALESALREASAVGITSLEDVTEPWALPLYGRLRAEGALTARICAWLPIDTEPAEREELRRSYSPDDAWIRVTTLKEFLDGTLGSRTAALAAPYADAPSSTGILRIEPQELREKVRAADAGGWAVALHAIGDRALSVALDALEQLPARERARPHRIEHVQVAAPADLVRLQRSRVLASIQPVHFLDDRAWIAARLGVGRAVIAYPWRSLLTHGIGVALGSDWPIATLDPRQGIAAATSRAQAGDLVPEEALSPEQALRGYTADSAAARGDGARAGMLKAGFDADFVVWSADPALGGDASVRATYVAGRRVWPEREAIR